MRQGAIALVVLLALVPGASACSLSRAPSGPGYIWLHDADGTLLRTIEVEEQSLTGDCGLGNVIGLTSRHLAWHDKGRVHRLDLATLDTKAFDLPRGDDVLLTLDGFIVREWQWDGTTSNSTWTLHRWDGEEVSLPLPRTWAYLVWHDGEHAVIQSRDAVRANVTSRIHDLGTGAVVAGPFGDDVVAGGRDWLVRSNGTGLALWRGGAVVGTVDDRYGDRITKHGLWTARWEETAQGERLRFVAWDGNASAELTPHGGLLAGTATHVVTGVFALAWRSDPFGLFAPGPVGLSIGILLLALAAVRRR